jgi:hypothetical protein
MSVGLNDEPSVPAPRAASEPEIPLMFAATERRASSGVLGGVRLLLIALWLGGAVFFSFVVAPSAFSVLPTHELAGAVVTRTIAVVNVGGFVVGLVLLATAFLASDDAARHRRAWLVEVASLAVVAVACGVGHWVVAARMIALRAAMGRPIDAVALDDPLRAAFNSPHGYSVGLMCAAMIAGIVALLAIARRRS